MKMLLYTNVLVNHFVSLHSKLIPFLHLHLQIVPLFLFLIFLVGLGHDQTSFPGVVPLEPLNFFHFIKVECLLFVIKDSVDLWRSIKSWGLVLLLQKFLSHLHTLEYFDRLFSVKNCFFDVFLRLFVRFFLP